MQIPSYYDGIVKEYEAHMANGTVPCDPGCNDRIQVASIKSLSLSNLIDNVVLPLVAVGGFRINRSITSRTAPTKGEEKMHRWRGENVSLSTQ